MCSGVQVRSVSIIQVLYNEQYFFMRVRFFASVVGKNKETRSHHSLYVPKKQIVYIKYKKSFLLNEGGYRDGKL